MKKNIYYIEDSELDFANFSNLLNSKIISVYPTKELWMSEIEVVKLYLQNSNEENKKRLVSIFKQYNIDLFLIDISLFHSDSGGITIYENLIHNNPDFKDKYVLFFTFPDSEELIITSDRVLIEFKANRRDGRIDYPKSGQRVNDKIIDLLDIRGGFESFIDDIY